MGSLFGSKKHNIYQDIDGDFLLSLSINDELPIKNDNLPSTDEQSTNDDDDDDDLMEIDTTYEIHGEQLPDHTTGGLNGNFTTKEHNTHVFDDDLDESNVKSQENNEDESIHIDGGIHDNVDDSLKNDDVEDTSMVSNLSNSLILSPTTLGAKLAIRKNLSTKESTKSTKSSTYDYEFDTSTYNKSIELYRDRLNHERNLSSFSLGVDARQFLAHESETMVSENEPNQFNKFSNNDMNQAYPLENEFRNTSLFGRPVSIPVQIHHHHYYNPPQNSNQELGYNNNKKANARNEMEIYDYQDDNNNKNKNNNNQLYLSTDQFKLPSPWEKESSPNEKVPYILMTYLQLMINLLSMGYASHIFISIVRLVKQDISHKLITHTLNVLVDIASCERQYLENNCSPDTLVPALERQCNYWLKCMNQDPFNGGGHKSLISAETIGMILNLLVQPLGWKFWLIISGLVVVTFACNFVFGYLRAKTYFGWGRHF